MTQHPRSREELLTELDTTVPHSARVWNYWLGGKDNFAVDRQVGEQVLQMLPSIVEQARADRAFLGRAVTHLAGERGIRQFLDIATGLPSADNTHEVAQRVAPSSRITYVDNDPLVLVHARARRARACGAAQAADRQAFCAFLKSSPFLPLFCLEQ